MGSRVAAVIHDLALALMVGSVAGAAVGAIVLFEHAPSREVAGEVGNAIFDAVGPLVAALSILVLLAGLPLRRLEPRPRVRATSTTLSLICVVAALLILFWFMPRMDAIWASAPHAPDGSGLVPEARARFMQLHGMANVCFLTVFFGGSLLVVLRAVRSLPPRG